MTMTDAELIAHSEGQTRACMKAAENVGYDQAAALKLAIECFDQILPLARKGLAASQPYDHAAEIGRLAEAMYEAGRHLDTWEDKAKFVLAASTVPQRLAAADPLLSQIWRTPFAYEKGKYHYGFSPELKSALHEYFYPKNTMTK
jgi:hypothetical protein